MNVLVFRVGQLGDMITGLPAFWVVREHFRGAKLTLLSDVQYGKKYVLAKDLLCGAGLFDEYLDYVVYPTRLRRLIYFPRLAWEIRKRQFDVLVYLHPTGRTIEVAQRHKRFFQLAGINKFLGIDHEYTLPRKRPGVPLETIPQEADLMLARLAASGLSIPPFAERRMDLGLNKSEELSVENWLSKKTSDGGRPWLGVGPGSKMPCKVWPEERYREVVTRLIERYDFWPVFFGGPEDADQGRRLIALWGRGYNSAGEIGLRESGCALRRCSMYLGSDSGSTHLAAAQNVPCVGIYAARNHPGWWHPYRVPQRVIRRQIECEGCQLIRCIERRMECILDITVDEVVDACSELWRETQAFKKR